MLKKPYFRLLALPLCLLTAAAVALASEIISIPLLVPVAMLVVLVGLVVASPGVAYCVGNAFMYLGRKNTARLLVAGALQRRAKTIGSTCVLLLLSSLTFVLVSGLGSAGVAEVSKGAGYWKPGYAWAFIKEEEKISTLIAEKPEDVLVFGQGRIKQQDSTSRNAFIMTCVEYQDSSQDDFVCPKTSAEGAGMVYLPENISLAKLKNEIYFPVADKTLAVELTNTIQVKGLTEVIIDPAAVLGEPLNLYFLIPPSDKQAQIENSLLQFTTRGFNTQENIYRTGVASHMGYARIVNILAILMLLTTLGAVCAIVGIAFQQRRKLLLSLFNRGMEPMLAKSILITESTHLTFPFVLTGIITGLFFAVVIASVSSLNPLAVFSPLLIIGSAIIIGFCLLIPKVVVKIV